ncbi:hypothetical protein PPNK14_13110 [Pectobacterium parmentieri]
MVNIIRSIPFVILLVLLLLLPLTQILLGNTIGPVIALVILEQVVQTLGDWLSKRVDKRERR